MRPQCKMSHEERKLREKIRKVLKNYEIDSNEKINKIYDLVK